MLYDDAFLNRLEARLRAALPRWGLGPDAPSRLLAVSENATFIVDDEAGASVVFRIYRPRYHTEAEIRSELGWIAALRSEDVVETPELKLTSDGDPLGTFDDDGARLHIAAFAFMSGAEPQPGAELTRWYAALGRTTARLHAHSRNWRRDGHFRRKTWDVSTTIGERACWGDWRAGPGLTADGVGVLERAAATLRRRLSAYGSGADRFGLIHADLRLTNLLIDGDRLGVIDFDDCGFSWFMFDFAASVSFMEHEPFIQELQDAWLGAYDQIARVSPEDVAVIPDLVMLRRIQLTAWIASHGETPAARSMGAPYTRGSLDLAERYLQKRG